MTRLFLEDGESVPVTAVSVCGNFVADIKTASNDGYTSLVVSKTKKSNNINKSKSEFYKKVNLTPGILAEFRCSEEQTDDFAVGSHLKADIFEVGQYVDVTGTSKGKGFQGVVKRYNFRGVGDATHGQHNRMRAPGSIGAASYPARVFKGMRMAGRMGGDQVTVANLEVLKVIKDKNLLVVKGSVPGPKNSLLTIEK